MLSTLGLKPRSQALPTVAKCPLCGHSRLTIYQDQIHRTEWFYCQDCKQAGDLIQLAAKVWQISLAGAVAKLARNNFDIPTSPEIVRSYLRVPIEQRRRVALFWKNARRQHPNTSTTGSKLVQELKFDCDLPEERRLWGPARLFGHSSVADVEKTYHAHIPKDATRSAVVSELRSFKGRGWDDVLVIPYRDLPQRICGFLSIGRNGDPSRDYVYKRTEANSRPNGPFEAGVAVHPEALRVASDFGNTLVALDSSVRMIQLQCRHFDQSLYPLPLIAWHRQEKGRNVLETNYAWHWLQNYNIVFWMPVFNLYTFKQAIKTNGKISTIGPQTDDEQAYRRYVANKSAKELTANVIRTGQPWPDVLAKHVQALPDEQVEDLFLHLELEGIDLDQVLSVCKPELQQRVREALPEEQGGIVNIDNVRVEERGGHWYSVNGNRSSLMVDAILRIEQVINYAKSNKVYYKGYIIYQDESIPFCESKALVDRDTFAWMQQVLIDREKGLLRFNPSRSRHAISVATQFKKPKFVKGIDIVGWDDRKARFVLPRFSVYSGGTIENHDTQTFSHNAPGRRLLRPEPLSGVELDELLPNGRFANLLWATIGSVMANILAPAYDEETRGIGLYGKGAAGVGEAVNEAFDCMTLPLGNSRDLDALFEAEHRHRWPIYVDVTPSLKKIARQNWVDNARGSRDCIMPADWWMYQAKRLLGGWNFVVDHDPVQISKATVMSIRKFVAAYLLDLCKRKMDMQRWEHGTGTWLLDVLQDMYRFVHPLANNAHWIKSAERNLTIDSDRGCAEAFGEMLSELLIDGKLSLVREGFQGDNKSILVQSDAGILVDRQQFTFLVNSYGFRLGDPLRITQVLANDDVLVEDRSDGWIVDESWWTALHKQRRAIDTRLLRLHA